MRSTISLCQEAASWWWPPELSDNLYLPNNMPVELLKSFGRNPQFRVQAVADPLDGMAQ